MLALLGGLALATARTERDGERQLERRFELRTELGATFSASYVQSVLNDQRRAAQTAFATGPVTRREFNAVVERLGFQFALLTDRKGIALQVWPNGPGVIGTDMSGQFPVLDEPLKGERRRFGHHPDRGRRGAVRGLRRPVPELGGPPGVRRRVHARPHAARRLPEDGSSLSRRRVQDRRLAGEHGRRNRAGRGWGVAREDRSGAVRRTGRARSRRVRTERETFLFARHPIDGTPWQLVSSVPKERAPGAGRRFQGRAPLAPLRRLRAHGGDRVRAPVVAGRAPRRGCAWPTSGWSARTSSCATSTA